MSRTLWRANTLFFFFELEQGCGWPRVLPLEVLSLYFSIIFWQVPHLVCQTCPHICELSGEHSLGSNWNTCIQTMKKYKWRRCESCWPWSHAICVTRTELSGEHSCCLPLESGGREKEWGEGEPHLLSGATGRWCVVWRLTEVLWGTSLRDSPYFYFMTIIFSPNVNIFWKIMKINF